jgi:hypothetical protein
MRITFTIAIPGTSVPSTAGYRNLGVRELIV